MRPHTTAGAAPRRLHAHALSDPALGPPRSPALVPLAPASGFQRRSSRRGLPDAEPERVLSRRACRGALWQATAMRRSTLATALLLLVQADAYQVLTTQGATCEPGLEITSAADCEAAIAEANAEIGKSGLITSELTAYDWSTLKPKGCSTTLFVDGNFGYSGAYLNSHATGSGGGSDPENDIYVHCLPGTVAPTIPHPDCTTACGESGWSGTGASREVEGMCYKCWKTGWMSNCPAKTHHRDDGNTYDDCCNLLSCTAASQPPPPSPSPPPPYPPPPYPSPPSPTSPPINGGGRVGFLTKDDLKAALAMWSNDRAAALRAYGPISGWDVSAITDMSYLFGSYSSYSFVTWEGMDLSGWDTSRVTDMSSMFEVRPPRACRAPGSSVHAACTAPAPACSPSSRASV